MKYVTGAGNPKASPYKHLNLDALIETSEIISIHLPLTPDTRGLLTIDRLAKAKQKPLLINTARGGIIEDAVALEALKRGYLSGFGADLLEATPPPAGYELLDLDNVLVTPHAASLTQTTYEDLCLITVQNAISLLEGEAIAKRFIFNR